MNIQQEEEEEEEEEIEEDMTVEQHRVDSNMNTKLAVFCLLLANTLAAPTSDDDKVVIDKDFFIDEISVYTAEHDIVSIMVPLNALNFEDNSDDEETDSDVIAFFVLADINNGVKDYKGLYMLKAGQAIKLLDQGTDAIAANDDTKNAYFSAKDGIYVYNGQENKTEKYGTITDNLIGIVKENGTGVIYVITNDHVLYKVTEEGTKKEKVDNVIDAQEIVLDFSNNLYYYGADKKPYVLTSDGKKEITGLPENPSSVKLIRPPFIIEDGVPFLVDDKLYVIYANGTSEITEFEVQTKPTAYAPEATLIQYYAYNKKIYEYNLLALLIGELLNELKEFLEEKNDAIQSIATRARTDLKAGDMSKLSVTGTTNTI
ncbi:hypothetical protein K1T71_013962 [Dendrolimus kikuchii]|uniref:Uncharacterized protein n=1 Tax=Dendrolimus kikuchii TaxID=765133 RepID=A0ACC1CG89_9NEOP|nr:hypothetical protein K1T71_013962 [Dendrolimus kikuchii]